METSSEGIKQLVGEGFLQQVHLQAAEPAATPNQAHVSEGQEADEHLHGRPLQGVGHRGRPPEEETPGVLHRHLGVAGRCG